MCCVFLLKAHHFLFNKINGCAFSAFLLLLIFHPFFFIVYFNPNSTFLILRMQNHNSLKKEFYKKWITSLQICNFVSKEKMNLLERKKVIKLSADLAMASTSRKRTWTRALITKATKDRETGTLAKKILGDITTTTPKTTTTTTTTRFSTRKHKSRAIFVRKNSNNTPRKKICKSWSRRHGCKNEKMKAKARSMAKRMVEKRREILKGLIPGGEYIMDEYSLVKETLDYVVSLQAQVHVMQHLANYPQLFYYS